MIRRAVLLKSASGKESSSSKETAPATPASQGTRASHGPQFVQGAPSGRAIGSLWRMREPARALDVIHDRPECRSLATPAAKKIRLINSHIIRIGHVYSPLGKGGGASGRRAARMSESTDHPSPQREKARIAIA